MQQQLSFAIAEPEPAPKPRPRPVVDKYRRCHAWGCGTRIVREYMFCPEHWRLLPEMVREELTKEDRLSFDTIEWTTEAVLFLIRMNRARA